MGPDAIMPERLLAATGLEVAQDLARSDFFDNAERALCRHNPAQLQSANIAANPFLVRSAGFRLCAANISNSARFGANSLDTHFSI